MQSVQHTSFYAMGTRCNIVLPNMEQDDAEAVFRHVQNEVARIEGKLSRFHEGSNIHTINKFAGDETVQTDVEVFDILLACSDYFDVTQGYFDITLRPILQFWKDEPNGDTESLDRILAQLGLRNIILIPETRTVKFKNKAIDIDLGGFGKGYALEKVGEMLNRFGIHSAFITMGESSVLTLGNHPAGDHWKVGIKHYLEPDESIHTFEMKNGSVSTSSNFYVDDYGKLVNHRHVINPKTGHPVGDLVTASVYSQSAQDAEVLSTAALTMSEEDIQLLVNQFPGIAILKVDYTHNQIQKKYWVYEIESANQEMSISSKT